MVWKQEVCIWSGYSWPLFLCHYAQMTSPITLLNDVYIYIYEINILYESAAYLLFFFSDAAIQGTCCISVLAQQLYQFPRVSISFRLDFSPGRSSGSPESLEKGGLAGHCAAGGVSMRFLLRWSPVVKSWTKSGVCAHVIPLYIYIIYIYMYIYIYGFKWNIQWWCFTMFYTVLLCSIKFFFCYYVLLCSIMF